MAEFSAETRTLTVKVMYCGPHQAGKATNLRMVHRVLEPGASAEALQPEPGAHRTLCLTARAHPLDTRVPINLRISVCSVSASVEDPEVYRAALRDSDGVVFVADGQRHRLRDNLVAWADLLEHLRILERGDEALPVVVQLNKMDDSSSMAGPDLDAAINPEGLPSFEAVASEGRGVGKCFSEVVRRVVTRAHSVMALDRHEILRGDLISAVDQRLVDLGAAARRSAASAEEAPAAVVPEPAVQIVEPQPEVSEPVADGRVDAESALSAVEPMEHDASPSTSVPVDPPSPLVTWFRQQRAAPADPLADRAVEYVRMLLQCVKAESGQLSGPLQEALDGADGLMAHLGPAVVKPAPATEGNDIVRDAVAFAVREHGAGCVRLSRLMLPELRTSAEALQAALSMWVRSLVARGHSDELRRPWIAITGRTTRRGGWVEMRLRRPRDAWMADERVADAMEFLDEVLRADGGKLRWRDRRDGTSLVVLRMPGNRRSAGTPVPESVSA